MNRCLIIIIVLCGSYLLGQAPPEPAPAAPGPDAAGPQNPASVKDPAPNGSEAKMRVTGPRKDSPQLKVALKSVQGALTKFDPKTQTFEVTVKEPGKDPVVMVFSFKPATRLFSADRKITGLKDAPLGTALLVNYAQPSPEDPQPPKANRIIINPPAKHGQTQPGGTGN